MNWLSNWDKIQVQCEQLQTTTSNQIMELEQANQKQNSINLVLKNRLIRLLEKRIEGVGTDRRKLLGNLFD